MVAVIALALFTTIQDSVVDSVVSDLTSAELNLLTQLVELFALLMQVRVKLLGLPRTL